MTSSVYIETTIPSAYVTTRTDPSSLHRKTSTRDWWEQQRLLYEICTPDNTLLELRKGS